VVPGLPAYQDPPHRSRISDAGGEFATRLLGGWQVGEIRAMAFAGMDDGHADGAGRLEQTPGRQDRPAQQRDVVAERRAKASGLKEVSLHIDDHESGT